MWGGEILENETEQLPRQITHVWQLTAVVTAIIIGAIGGGSLAIGLSNSLSFFTVCGWLIIGNALVILIAMLALVPYRWRFWTYRISDRDVELHKGYFFRKQIVIPIARVQNVTLDQGPFLRWQKLQEIAIVTAATSHKIDGVSPETAEQLKELIMKLAKEARNDL